ncbi:gastric triacylglycerol lipase-like isoform X2 [Corticium candelabrum]|uniref:gastric triacylglycerol lipase-like isoform X2 n=1 Tax=Corticium candelabrum TaxID=121492 RepID=UPI002E265C71|nr:gastric triacylglycerol lipase-like isoform X2 [Corticium candelabrum]
MLSRESRRIFVSIAALLQLKVLVVVSTSLQHSNTDNTLNDGLPEENMTTHGIIASSADWVSNSQNESLAFLLADQGFDVWLGNVRGNTYSKNHTKLKPNQEAFWAWSWDEMARYDLPAMLGYVMNYTEQSEIFYAGHSQGTTMAFAGFSINKELSSHIKAFFAFAPITTVTHMKGLVPLLADISPELKELFKILGVNDFAPSGPLTHYFAQQICGSKLEVTCGNIVFLIAGFDEANLNKSRIPVYLSHTPAGTSVRDFVHFAQEYKSGKFQKYDFGSSKANADHYNGMTTPPMYNLTDFYVPVYTYAGSNDWIADPSDVSSLIPQLKTLRGNMTIEGYNHMDFIWGTDARKKVYGDVIQHAKSLL